MKILWTIKQVFVLLVELAFQISQIKITEKVFFFAFPLIKFSFVFFYLVYVKYLKWWDLKKLQYYYLFQNYPSEFFLINTYFFLSTSKQFR